MQVKSDLIFFRPLMIIILSLFKKITQIAMNCITVFSHAGAGGTTGSQDIADIGLRRFIGPGRSLYIYDLNNLRSVNSGSRS